MSLSCDLLAYVAVCADISVYIALMRTCKSLYHLLSRESYWKERLAQDFPLYYPHVTGNRRSAYKLLAVVDKLTVDDYEQSDSFVCDNVSKCLKAFHSYGRSISFIYPTHPFPAFQEKEFDWFHSVHCDVRLTKTSDSTLEITYCEESRSVVPHLLFEGGHPISSVDQLVHAALAFGFRLTQFVTPTTGISYKTVNTYPDLFPLKKWGLYIRKIPRFGWSGGFSHSIELLGS